MKKINLLFGGNRGIGLEIKKIFKKKKLITINRSKSSTNNIQCDLLDIESLNKLIKKLKNFKIENMVFSQRYRGNDNLEEYKLMISSPLHIIESLKKSFTKNASIIFIGSICTDKVALDQDAHYHSIRYGIVGITKYLAYSLGKKKIRVNMVSTNKILKKENLNFYNVNKVGKNIKKKHLLKTPIKKMLSAKDVANSIKFLTSSDAQNLTGLNMYIDGGEHLM